LKVPAVVILAGNQNGSGAILTRLPSVAVRSLYRAAFRQRISLDEKQLKSLKPNKLLMF
jgi:hypothetical protein